MSTRSLAALGAAVAATGLLASSLVAPPAQAAGSGTLIEAVDKGGCTAEFTLTNFTNSPNYMPDWWFEAENPPASYPLAAPPAGAEINPPWRILSGVPWPIARYVGDPALRSGVAEGIPPWTGPGSGTAYSSTVQGPDGYKTTKTIALKDATDPAAPAAGADGTLKIFYRIALGPQTADRDQEPKELVVTGCGSSGGNGSLDSGSGSGSLDSGSLDSGSLDLGSLMP